MVAPRHGQACPQSLILAPQAPQPCLRISAGCWATRTAWHSHVEQPGFRRGFPGVKREDQTLGAPLFLAVFPIWAPF